MKKVHVIGCIKKTTEFKIKSNLFDVTFTPLCITTKYDAINDADIVSYVGSQDETEIIIDQLDSHITNLNVYHLIADDDGYEIKSQLSGKVIGEGQNVSCIRSDPDTMDAIFQIMLDNNRS